MIRTKLVNKPYAFKQTTREKLVSVLRKPLFTITLFPEMETENNDSKKKPEPQVTAKPVKQKKAMKEKYSKPLSVETSQKQTVTQDTSPGREGVTKIFTPSRNKEEYEKILFALRACNKHTGSVFTNVLHIEKTGNGSRLIATDGKRMHVTEIGTKIKPGDYKPVVTHNSVILGKPVSDVVYPDWKRVVPKDVIRRGVINLENANAWNKSHVSDSFTKLSGEKLNPDYLTDLTKKPWVIYCQKEKRKPLMLKEFGAKKDTYAVIMPLAA